MGCNLTASPPSFFVCGTPSNRHGFEYKALDDRHPPPPQLAKYLDDIPKEKFPDRGEPTHIFGRVRTGEIDGAIYAECRWIHPNDTEHNRGAYIAVGCWAEAPLTVVEIMEALDRIEGIHDDLAAHRDPGAEAFLPDFRLRAYTAPKPAETNRRQLAVAKLLHQASAGIGPWEGKAGRAYQTSEEVGRRPLPELCFLNSTTDQAPLPQARRDNRGWQSRLTDVMQEAMSEAPRTRQLLRKLSDLEEQRIRIVKTLSRAVNEAPRRPRTPSGRTVGSPRWIPTPREVGWSVAGIVLGTAIALAVVGAVTLLSEDEPIPPRPAAETGATSSASD